MNGYYYQIEIIHSTEMYENNHNDMGFDRDGHGNFIFFLQKRRQQANCMQYQRDKPGWLLQAYGFAIQVGRILRTLGLFAVYG